MRDRLADHYDVLDLPVPPGEAAKTAAVAARCWEALGAAGFTRSDAVVTVGGGATTDLGGFVAATWLRGVRVVHVPTTLLGMVDAAVGGKTGINTDAGKNLVGAFHEPAGVLCDLDLLATLPAAELRSGLGEVVKCGFIADPEILRLVEGSERPGRPGPLLRELVERAVRVKADVVAGDLRETGGERRAPRPRGAQLRPHHGPRGRAGERLLPAARRGGRDRVRVRRRAGPAAGLLDDAVADRHRTALEPGRAADRLGRRVVRRPPRPDGGRQEVARRPSCGSWCSTDLARPRILADPGEEHLRAAYDVMTEAAR